MEVCNHQRSSNYVLKLLVTAASDTVCPVHFLISECSNCPFYQIVSAIGIFLYLIAKNPHVQRKAQEEIDRVIGKGRLPDLTDRPDLPYIEAIYRELLRYEPPSKHWDSTFSWLKMMSSMGISCRKVCL
jgi:hypothetical protein